MKIGIDGAYALAGNYRNGKSKAPGANDTELASLGREEKTREVIESLATDYPNYSLLIYTPKVGRKTRLSLIDELHNAEYRLPAPSGFTGRMWRLFGITNCLLPDKIDVYHGINGELPLNIAAGHVPTVVTVSNADIFDTPAQKTEAGMYEVKKPAGIFEIGKRIEQYVKRESWKNSTLIIAASTAVELALTANYGIEDSKIIVIPPSRQTAEALMGAYTKAIALFPTR